MVQVIILNGGSSSGKSTITKLLQNSLRTPWLRFSIDDLLDAMPERMLEADSGITFGSDGSVNPGTEFRTLESAWMRGIASMIRSGARVIIDDVFLSGIEGRNRWEVALEGLEVLWVGVFCDSAVASARESKREDRITGMATSQANVVHVGMDYDLKVDTTVTSPEECVQVIARRIYDR